MKSIILKICVPDKGKAPPIYLQEVDGRYVPMRDKDWTNRVAHYTDLSDKAQAKFMKEKMKEEQVVCKARVNAVLENNSGYLEVSGKQRRPTPADCRAGVITLFNLSALFPERAAGYTLIAVLLSGMMTWQLREKEPSFTSAVLITTGSRLYPMFTEIIKSIIPHNKWQCKRCVVKRSPLIDLKAHTAKIQNFSYVTVRYKKHKSVPLPFPYYNTLVLVSGAEGNTQSDKLPSNLDNAGVIYFNAKLGKERSNALPSFSIEKIDSAAAEEVKRWFPYLAPVFHWWQRKAEEEDLAEGIIKAAIDSLGQPDSRYRKVEYDAKLLNPAVLHQVLLTFLDAVEEEGWLTGEELEYFRSTVQSVFVPDPAVSDGSKAANDPDVFLSIMRKLVEENADRITPIGEIHYKSKNQKQFTAAWRKISNVDYLVVDETVFTQCYPKAVRADKSIDDAPLHIDNWERDLQKDLVSRNYIKAASSGFRYRYHLYEPQKDVYVLAIPKEKLQK